MNPQDDVKGLQAIAFYIENNFRVTVGKIKTPLKELFPEPEKKHLQRFWGNNSHADIPVFRHHKLVCIIEPGGKAHFSDKKQRTRDKKKFAICKLNGVNLLHISKGVIRCLNDRKTKRLFRKYIYG